VINSAEKLAALLPELQAAEWIAIDTEADSLHAYPEKLCVLQISVTGRDELIDPLAGTDLNPVWSVLRPHELILHGADYDLRLLRRGFGFVPERIFDTMLAARLLGCQEFGLSNLVSAKLGIQLEKGPQKMDWSRRPLTERMERYARNDTRHLRPLTEILTRELEDKGRLEWQKESCARLINETATDRKPDPETIWRIRGSDRLPPKGLAILRGLWHWREAEAIKANKPPYFIFSHELLVSVALHAAQSETTGQAMPRMSGARRESFLSALDAALNLPSSEHPGPKRVTGRRLTAAEQNAVEALRKKRDRVATELALDPALIASRATLVEMARNGGDEAKSLMGWQRRLLTES
jgi:ribonuclease D